MTVAHPRPGQPYHEVNSIRGVQRAARDHDEIDLDTLRSMPNPKCRICRKRGEVCIGHDVGTHWRRPLEHGFRDPLRWVRRRKIPKDTPVEKLTYEQLHSFVAGRGYRIWLTDRLLAECAKVGIGAVIEPKGGPAYTLDRTWRHLHDVAEDVGCHLRMYVLRNSPTPGYGERVQPVAARNGVPGKVIH